VRHADSAMNARSDRGGQSAIRQQIERLGPWFHNLTLSGVQTAPDHFLGDYPRHFFSLFSSQLPADLRGWSVLDVGCNGGFYSLEMKRRGAERVVALDTDPRYLRQARFAADIAQQAIELRERSVYDVGSLGQRFDLVLFLGVLYHLRHPLLALDLLRRYSVGRLLIFQTMIRGSEEIPAVASDYEFEDRSPFETAAFPKLHFIEKSYAHDQTNWWVPNRACAEAMLRAAGFEIVSNPVGEVYVCRPAAVAPDLPPQFEERSRG
jgi:tRNA (mo5U34)-methyltransferase